jgi:hypothetical protein
MKAICINADDKFIMIKKYTSQSDEILEYLIVSLDTFKQHEKYFKDNKY